MSKYSAWADTWDAAADMRWEPNSDDYRAVANALRELEAGLSSVQRSYETEYDGRMIEICTSCEAQLSDGQAHKPRCFWLTAKGEGDE